MPLISNKKKTVCFFFKKWKRECENLRMLSLLLTANGDGGSENRLAFYEARPCSICGKMYRDAASLRTHTSIMHTTWRDGFECSCKMVFQTKHEMYQHRRSHGKLWDMETVWTIYSNFWLCVHFVVQGLLLLPVTFDDQIMCVHRRLIPILL